MIKNSSNLKLIKDDKKCKELYLCSSLRDFNLAINYSKKDEISVEILIKILPIDSENWFYLSEINNEFGIVNKKNIVISSSDSFVVHIDNIPQNKGLIMEINYKEDSENPIINEGDFEILIFTYKAK